MSRREIPAMSRAFVKTREQFRCARCASPTNNNAGDWHHRRSRSVRDDHTHSTCNGVWLCRTCHNWVHAHPFEARSSGFIVSRHSEPCAAPLKHALLGWVTLNHDGTTRPFHM